MSSAHTPGPWRLEAVKDRTIKHLCPVGADDLSLLTVVQHDDTPFAAVYSDDDALLIAAAPDLLSALKGMCGMWQSVCGVHGWNPEHLAQYTSALEAISKAMGDKQ